MYSKTTPSTIKQPIIPPAEMYDTSQMTVEYMDDSDSTTYGYTNDGLKITKIRVRPLTSTTQKEAAPVMVFTSVEENNLVKKMFLMIPNLCYKFNAILSQKQIEM